MDYEHAFPDSVSGDVHCTPLALWKAPTVGTVTFGATGEHAENIYCYGWGEQCGGCIVDPFQEGLRPYMEYCGGSPYPYGTISYEPAATDCLGIWTFDTNTCTVSGYGCSLLSGGSVSSSAYYTSPTLIAFANAQSYMFCIRSNVLSSEWKREDVTTELVSKLSGLPTGNWADKGLCASNWLTSYMGSSSNYLVNLTKVEYRILLEETTAGATYSLSWDEVVVDLERKAVQTTHRHPPLHLIWFIRQRMDISTCWNSQATSATGNH